MKWRAEIRCEAVHISWDKEDKLIYISTYHPTVKPVELMKYLIELFIGKGRIVLDPFSGVGTTHIAADLLGYLCIAIDAEIDYCQLGRRRSEWWRAHLAEYLTTGQIPIVKDTAMPLFE